MESKIAETVNDDSVKAFEETIEILRKEYGDRELTKEMRKELQIGLGKDAQIASNWQKFSDILDGIDLYTLAEKNPETVCNMARTAASIVGTFFPVVNVVKDRIPDESIARIVQLASYLTPEHLLNMAVKKRIEMEQTAIPGIDIDVTQNESEEDIKTLVVVCKDDLLLSLLQKLIETNDDTDGTVVGTKDGSIKMVTISEKIWKIKKQKLISCGQKILFIGDVKDTENLRQVVDKKFRNYGVYYGWFKNQAIVIADYDDFKENYKYEEFAKGLQELPVPDIIKNPKTSAGKTAWGYGVAGAVLGPIGIGVAGMAQHQKNKATVIRQMLFYGVVNLYNNDLEAFINS